MVKISESNLPLNSGICYVVEPNNNESTVTVPMAAKQEKANCPPPLTAKQKAGLEAAKEKKIEKYSAKTKKLEKEFHQLEETLSGLEPDSAAYKKLDKKCNKVFREYQKAGFMFFALAEGYVPDEAVKNIDSDTEEQIALEYMQKRTEIFDKATGASNEEEYQRQRIALEERFAHTMKQYEGKEIPPSVRNEYIIEKANLIMHKNDKWPQWSISDLERQNEIYSGSDELRQKKTGFDVSSVSSELKFDNQSNTTSTKVNAEYNKGKTTVEMSAGADVKNYYEGKTVVIPRADVNVRSSIQKFGFGTGVNYYKTSALYGETYSDTNTIAANANLRYQISERSSISLSSYDSLSYTDTSAGYSYSNKSYSLSADADFPLAKTLSASAGASMSYETDSGHMDSVNARLNFINKNIQAGVNSTYSVSDLSKSYSQGANFSIASKNFHQDGGVRFALQGQWTAQNSEYDADDYAVKSHTDSFNTSESLTYKNKKGRSMTVSHGGYYYKSRMKSTGNTNSYSYFTNTISAMFTGLGKDKKWGLGAHYMWTNAQDSPNEAGVSVNYRF